MAEHPSTPGSAADDRPAPQRRSAIVTGAAAGGIGEAEAEALVASGHVVVLNDVSAEGLDEVVARIGGPGVARGVVGDISSPDTARELVAAATGDGLRLSAVVSNAAVQANKRIDLMSDADFDRVHAVSVRGTFLLSREAVRHWRAEIETTGEVRGGCLINTTSRSALLANPNHVNYSSAKAAVASMSQTLARELSPIGVRCNAVAPQAYTKMVREALGEFEESAIEGWSPRHVGRFVDFLCSEAAAEINGQVFFVHGPNVSLARPWELTEPATLDFGPGADAVTKAVTEMFQGAPTSIPPFHLDGYPLAAGASKNPFAVDSTR